MPDELFAHLAALCETEKQTPKKKNDTLGLAGSREGSRNEEMRDYVWRLVHTRGMREDEIRLLARTKWENTEQGDHPFPWEEAEAMIDRALGKVELQSPVEDADELVEFAANLHHTDMGAAEWIVRLYGDNLRYCYKWRRWLVWDGKRWTMDGEAQAMELAKQAVRKLQHAGLSIPDDTKRPALVKWALGLERHDAREKALADARSSLPIAADDLDRDPWLFNCANGTIDLRTGELRPHRREDYITKLSPFDYLPDAQCPAWVDHLRHIHDGDQEMVDFLQRAFGYSISGVTDERILFLAYGGGANGKTLTHETIAMVLADYALRASISVFLQKERGGVPNDVAALRGARFVYASEPDQGKRLAEGTIKDLTGGDTISARFLHGEFFTFKPACKLWLGTNHRLTVRGTDEAIWDRIREIPYVVSIPRAKRLPREAMLEIFQREGSGILAWLIQGCLAWQREGLKMPQKVVEATNAYREEQDALGMFLAECCERRKGAQCAYATLYQVYQEYCEEMGDEPCKRKGFTTRLREKGIVTDKGTGNQTICLDVKLLRLPRERLKVVNYQ
jgi:putative DNA primase/helicase